MPPRSIIAVIVLFWAGTIGWFVEREVWPVLFPGQSPPFLIDLADEVTSEIAGARNRPAVLWSIYRTNPRTGQEDRIGRAETFLQYHREDNTFTMRTRVSDLKLHSLITIAEANTSYRIDRYGELRAIDMSMNMRLLNLVNGWGKLRGEVRGDQLIRSGEVGAEGMGQVTPEFEPIPAPSGSVLNPLHPIPKLKGLTPGRRWEMPLMNPMGDAVEPIMRAMLKNSKLGENFNVPIPASPKSMYAEVLNETVMIPYNGRDVECFVVRFEGGNQTARTFVRVTDNAVMQQEAAILGETVTLRRE